MLDDYDTVLLALDADDGCPNCPDPADYWRDPDDDEDDDLD